MAEYVLRKISESGQIRLPKSFDIASAYFVLEPGEYTPPGMIKLYPVDQPPVHNGPMTGEQIRAPVTAQNHLTIPAQFRKPGFSENDTIYVFNEGSTIVLTPTEDDLEEEPDEEAVNVDENKSSEVIEEESGGSGDIEEDDEDEEGEEIDEDLLDQMVRDGESDNSD
ncbi:hypothetical protein [Halorhabdus rudnickae]|uniref:hypothetical protein n=1 Tax=Halorhabdus rudnickae TaxID=1775544 RepID=UPI00108350BB|nr:hypothetical protein [Halorhabdus rudnickae]